MSNLASKLKEIALEERKAVKERNEFLKTKNSDLAQLEIIRSKEAMRSYFKPVLLPRLKEYICITYNAYGDNIDHWGIMVCLDGRCVLDTVLKNKELPIPHEDHIPFDYNTLQSREHLKHLILEEFRSCGLPTDKGSTIYLQGNLDKIAALTDYKLFNPTSSGRTYSPDYNKEYYLQLIKDMLEESAKLGAMRLGVTYNLFGDKLKLTSTLLPYGSKRHEKEEIVPLYEIPYEGETGKIAIISSMMGVWRKEIENWGFETETCPMSYHKNPHCTGFVVHILKREELKNEL